MNQTTQTQYESAEAKELQSEAEETSVQFGAGSGKTDISALKSEVESTAKGFNVTGFKCLESECGIHHGHSTVKHQAGDSTGADESQMDANPTCHCGYNELAHRGDEIGASGAPSVSGAANTAPIPDEMHRRLQKA